MPYAIFCVIRVMPSFTGRPPQGRFFLKSGFWGIREIKILMGEAGNVAALTQALQDPDPEARFMFLEVLKTMGDIARPAIAQAVHDPDPRVSKTAQIILNDMANHSPQ